MSLVKTTGYANGITTESDYNEVPSIYNLRERTEEDKLFEVNHSVRDLILELETKTSTITEQKMKTKHNKKRNTAFVYEALIKEATVAILKNETDKHTKVVDLIKKYFNGDSILRKDLDCYRSLYENQNLSPETCARIITESKFRRKMITPDHLLRNKVK